ncbi:ABC transporter related protein [Candidatus Vecturithrix granuli]|uniref:ABC transporter related protein n=1 Tax=Vecturithrix granuli TaxID=1499967 RepID=A0A081BWQ0_VECG1|nr:ABC transporter related protein [Candidatus Vecturithrix granuli]
MKTLKRFIIYYRPHLALFLLDMGVAVIAAVASIVFPALTRILLKDYLPAQNTRMITVILSICAGLMVVKAVSTYIRIKWGHILGVRMEYDMRTELFSHIQKLSFSYFDNVKTGHIMSRISTDLNQIVEIAHHAPEDILISTLMIVGTFGFMFAINVQLALITLIPVAIMIWWMFSYGTKMHSGFHNVLKKIADINSSVENSVQGIREVKSYANEALELKKFEDVNHHFKFAKEHIYAVLAVFYTGMNFLADGYYLLVISVGVFLMYDGKLDMPDLVAFLLYVTFILDPIKRLNMFAEYFQQGFAAFGRFVELMDVEPDITDRKHASTFEPVKGEISFMDVTFKYQSSPDWVLRNVSFNVPAGKTIAMVGESGAGKSTVVSLIPRFYEPQQGKICIDGHDVMDLKQRFLREHIGIVQQNVFLFDATIRENILYGKPDATEAELIEAAQRAYIYDFIRELPEGFDAYVGERGVKLSGGQKQRISIARVFLKNPPILIFDEATSSLDSESEASIQKAMEALSKDRTTIIIAHRLSTVKKADTILVLRKGEIIEIGNHDSLVKQRGYYYTLYSTTLL